MKKNTGITLVELVIVIIIIIIIATFSVITGRQTLDETDKTEVYQEINTIKTVANSIIVRQDLNEDFKLEEGKHYDFSLVDVLNAGLIPSSNFSSDIIDNKEDWYIIFGKDKEVFYNESKVKDELGLEQINRSYIVNYKDTKVELLEPITLSGVTVRTYDEIRALISE